MSDKCEPPPELRGVDGWHWLSVIGWPEAPYRWSGDLGRWADVSMGYESAMAYREGYRYLAPVTLPAEVEALRAELKRCEAACFDVQADNITLRAEVARLTAERDATAHDRRVTELLEANNQEVERRRTAEGEVRRLRAEIIDCYCDGDMRNGKTVERT